MEAQNFKFVYCTLTSQSNLEKIWSWKNQGPWLQITVQATVNKNEEKIFKRWTVTGKNTVISINGTG